MIIDKFYAFYNESTGEVWKVSPQPDENDPHIAIDLDLGIDIVDGKRNMKDYVVMPSTDLTFELQLKNSDYQSYDVDKSIHHFKIVNEVQKDENALQVIHNFKKGTIGISAGEGILNFLKSNMYFRKRNLYIYFTKRNDPNILIDTVTVPYYEILNNDIFFIDVNKNVANNTDMSVYCGKVFENYYYVVTDA